MITCAINPNFSSDFFFQEYLSSFLKIYQFPAKYHKGFFCEISYKFLLNLLHGLLQKSLQEFIHKKLQQFFQKFLNGFLQIFSLEFQHKFFEAFLKKYLTAFEASPGITLNIPLRIFLENLPEIYSEFLSIIFLKACPAVFLKKNHGFL